MSSRPVHFEIHAADPERAAAFYSSVFGWKIERWGEVPYWLISTGEGPGIDGGLLPRHGAEPAADAPVNGFPVTMSVEDIDDMLERIMAAGGTLALPKHAVAGVGWLAYCKDTEGNIFGTMQSDESAG
jgi:predicted enzyme related to lactoylglutathione lyase